MVEVARADLEASLNRLVYKTVQHKHPNI